MLISDISLTFFVCDMQLFCEDALPEGFSQQFDEQQQKTRAKFYSPVPRNETRPVPNNKKEDDSEKKVHSRIKDMMCWDFENLLMLTFHAGRKVVIA